MEKLSKSMSKFVSGIGKMVILLEERMTLAKKVNKAKIVNYSSHGLWNNMSLFLRLY